jgi:hypothetical protein
LADFLDENLELSRIPARALTLCDRPAFVASAGIVHHAHVFFKHEDDGTAPQFALRLMQVMGAQPAPA